MTCTQRLDIHLLLITIFDSPSARFRNFQRVDWLIRLIHFPNLVLVKLNVRTPRVEEIYGSDMFNPLMSL